MFARIILKNNNFGIEGLTIYADIILVCQDNVIILGCTKLVLKKKIKTARAVAAAAAAAARTALTLWRRRRADSCVWLVD